MMKHYVKSVILVITAFAAAFFILPSRAAIGQQKQPPLPFAEHVFLNRAVQVSAKQKSLADVIASLCSQTGISIVTDGLPDKTGANIEVIGTIRDALNVMTDAFDCDWSVSKSGIVMVCRKFKDPAEHPQIHVKELREMVRDIHTAFQLLPPGLSSVKYAPLLWNIFYSFSAEQAAACANGTLTGAGLNPEQFAWMGSAFLARELNPQALDCDEIAQHMEGLTKSFLQMKPTARITPGLDLTSQISNEALFPSFDYLYVFRNRAGKIVSKKMSKVTVN